MLLNNYLNPILLSFVAGIATTMGVIIGWKFTKTKNNLTFGMSFSGTIMLLIAFFELIPSVYHSLGILKIILSVVLGVILIFTINTIIPHIHTIKEIKGVVNKNLMKISYLLAFGLILHDFPEGFVIASSYHDSRSTGLLVAAALFIHNLPEGYVLSVALIKNVKKVFSIKLSLLSALSTILGTVLGLMLVNNFSAINPILTALAAGSMIYISIHELLPMSYHLKNKKEFYFGGFAAIFAYFLLTILF